MHIRTTRVLPFRHVWGITCISLLLLQGRFIGQAAEGAVPGQLETILGAPIEKWRIAPYSGAANDYILTEIGGAPVLVGGPNATILTSIAPVEADWDHFLQPVRRK